MYNTTQSSNRKYPTVLAIGGGKGGVGKSLLSGNLGVLLAAQHKRVVLVDMDLGCTNLHTCLGMAQLPRTLADFFKNPTMTLSHCIVPTTYPRLGLISSHCDVMGVANPKSRERQRLAREIRRLPADFVILDLGAGINMYTLDFFLNAHLGLVAVLPEPTSVENLYHFIKAISYRRMKIWEIAMNVPIGLDMLIAQSNINYYSPLDIIANVRKRHPELGLRLQENLNQWPLHLVVNGVRNATEAQLGMQMQRACQQFLGVPLLHVGTVPYDDAVWQAVRRRQPVVSHLPESPASKALAHLAARLVA